MWLYGLISGVIAPMIVLKVKPELNTFTVNDLAPSMADAMASMPNMENLIEMARYMSITTFVVSAIAAYLLACIVVMFVETKQSNKSLKQGTPESGAP